MARYGDKHSGGRKTKAEEMGLEKNLNESFKKLSVGKIDGVQGAEGILQLMWEKAIDERDYKAIEWIAHRYYGKEPKAIISDINVNGTNRGSIKEFFGSAFEEDGDDNPQ